MSYSKKNKMAAYHAAVILMTITLVSGLAINPRNEREVSSFARPRIKRSPGRQRFTGNVKVLPRESQKCPTLSYCDCRKGRRGLDITCTHINERKLQMDCDELRKKERFVRYFKIRNSNIPKLENNIFMGIKIEHLYIHDSHLEHLAPLSLSSQGGTLRHLVMSKNRLTEVPSEALKTLAKLDHLNLNENNLTVLHPKAFLGLKKVTRLSLYNNQIYRIDKNAFNGLTRDLTRLNMGKNRLTKIPKDALIPLKYLQILELTENRISKITPGDFIGMDSLDHLTLNNNLLTHLGAEYFKGLTSLTTLYLDSNKISLINKDAFVDLEAKLQSLTLASNEISMFPSQALKKIHQLEVLHLEDNKITVLDEDAFQGFGEHIKNLWMQHNLIGQIAPTAFQDLHSLEWVKLFNNNLKTLHYELMEPVLDTLMHIDIHSNPLICDCELRWYRQWIEEEWNEIDEEWLQETYCLDPADKKEHNIAEVPLKDMFCTEDVSDKPPRISDGRGAGSLLAWTIGQIMTINVILLAARWLSLL